MNQRTSKPAPKAVIVPGPMPASELFKGRREIEIEHEGETYRLRITRNQKLILTK